MARTFSDSDFQTPRTFADSDFKEDTPTTSNQEAMNYLFGKNIQSSGFDPLGKMAQVGQFANQGNQQLMGNAAEAMGQIGVNPYVSAALTTPYATVSEFLMPQTRLGAALTALPAATKAFQGARSLFAGGEVPGAAANVPAQISSGGQAASRASQLGQEVGSSNVSLPPELEAVKAQKGPILKQWAQAMLDWNNSANELSSTPQNAAITDPLHPLVRQTNDSFNKIAEIEKSNPDITNYFIKNFPTPDLLSNLAGETEQSTGAVSALAKQNPPGALAQAIVARAGRGKITPSIAQYAIDNPDVLNNAPSLKDATDNYVQAIGGLQGKAASLAQRLNKTVIRPSDYDAAIDRAGRLLRGTPTEADAATQLSPQDALEGLQSVNQALRDKMYTSAMHPDQVKNIMQVKEGLLDYLSKAGNPNIRAAGQQLFEANVKDAFSKWLPQNKFGSPDALRSMAGMGQLGTAASILTGGIATGHPFAGIAAAAAMAMNSLLTSPKIWGSAIQNAAAFGRPMVQQGIQAAAVGGSNLFNYNPSPYGETKGP